MLKITRSKNEVLQAYLSSDNKDEAAKKLGIGSTTFQRLKKEYNIPNKPRKKQRKDLTNCRFGKLLAIDSEKVNSRIKWICICDCGNQKKVDRGALLAGATKSCGCIKKNWKGYGQISGQQFSRIRYSATIRKLDFKISIEYIWELFLLQNKKCSLTGVSLHLEPNYMGKISKNTASLDRIDSSKGYIEGNVQWVHQKVNIIKNDLSEQELYDWCKLIINKFEKNI